MKINFRYVTVDTRTDNCLLSSVAAPVHNVGQKIFHNKNVKEIFWNMYLITNVPTFNNCSLKRVTFLFDEIWS